LPTEKNLPATKFIKSVGDQFRNEIGTSWTFPAEYLANLEYEPGERARTGNETSADSNTNTFTRKPVLEFGVVELSGRLQRIAESLCDVGQLTKAIEEYRFRKVPPPTDVDLTGATALQTAVMNIWRRVLGRPRIGMNDNFFDAGGTSLRAVQVIATIKKELKQNLSIVSLFECPTVTLLAANLSAAPGERQGGANAAGAALRGQKRRTNVMRRKAN
jgi:acyl carrier protein